MTSKQTKVKISKSNLPLNWKKKLPLWLTLSRMVAAPVIVAVLLLSELMAEQFWAQIIVAALFIAASLTDYYDGHFARIYKAESNMGKFMDPVADKVLVSATLIMLLYLHRIDPIVVILLILRDLIIGGVRAAAAADQIIIAAKPSGKWKTGLQMIAVPMLLLNTPIFYIPLFEIGYALIWLSVILSFVSGYQYVRLFFKGRK